MIFQAGLMGDFVELPREIILNTEQDLQLELSRIFRKNGLEPICEFKIKGHKDYKSGVGFLDVYFETEFIKCAVEVKKSSSDFSAALRQIAFYRDSCPDITHWAICFRGRPTEEMLQQAKYHNVALLVFHCYVDYDNNHTHYNQNSLNVLVDV